MPFIPSLSAMLSIDYRASTSNGDEDRGDEEIRDIHALTPPPPPPPPPPQVRAWETSSHRSSTLSTTSEGGPSENFTSMSREFSALLNIAGSGMRNNVDDNDGGAAGNSLTRIREDREMPDETNLLAIVPETSLLDPLPSPSHAPAGADSSLSRSSHSEVSLQRVKKEEVEAKISAWQTAKIAKINNRFKREDAIINGWESEQIQKTASWMKKVEVT